MKKVVVTYHGNIGRWNRAKNAVENLAMRMAHRVLLLNEESFSSIDQKKVQAVLASAFFPPAEEEYLPNHLKESIESFRKEGVPLYCTNASNLAHDLQGDEIYGISDLVNIFRGFPEKQLVISDPTSGYKRYLANLGVEISSNILFITEPHSFYAILKESRILIRATSTDGDSISVREALHLGLRVIASDCVTRPKHVESYEKGNLQELKILIESENWHSYKADSVKTLEQIILLYRDILRD